MMLENEKDNVMRIQNGDIHILQNLLRVININIFENGNKNEIQYYKCSKYLMRVKTCLGTCIRPVNNKV